MLSDARIEYSWNTIYIALLYDFIETSEVKEYAIKEMSSDDYQYNESINKLAWGTTDKSLTIRLILSGNLVKITDSVKEFELKKIRYVMLFALLNQYKNPYQTLLKQIERVYADFDYPDDLSSFVYYMSPTNSTSTKVTNIIENDEKDFVLKFSEFLKGQAQKIR